MVSAPPAASSPPGPPPTRPSASRLSGDDWADAALVAIGRGGLAGVAVESLAMELGATKGSFYHHFPNRAAVIDAALARWEADHTEAVIAAMEAEPDPTERMRRLLRLVIGVSRHDRIEMALLANAEHPQVAPVVERVTRRRIDYVATLYRELGLTPATAHRRALLAVSVYVGHTQIARTAPDALPTTTAQWRRHLDAMVDALIPPD